MGDPRKIRKKYKGPSHPWQKARMDEEKELRKEYALTNKKELWKVQSLMRSYSMKAKKLIAARGEQAEKEKISMLASLQKLGLVSAEGNIDMVLGLSVRDFLERRLQTQVYKKNLARSMKQARQFITHQHIIVNNKKITSPSYLVPLSEEASLTFVENSSLVDPEHPERAITSESSVKKEQQKEAKEAKEKKGSKKESKKEEKVEAPKTETSTGSKEQAKPVAEEKPAEKAEA
jgi:small subunit ribosomal protein S4